jgi:HSP20 family protein
MKTLIPWRRNELGLFRPFRQEVEDLFERFFTEPYEEAYKPMVWTPRVDIEETPKEILVKVDLPGVEAKEVDISIVEGCVVLQGEKKEEHEEKKKGFHRYERFVGKFYRELPLPPGADPEKILATSAKGVITVIIPKKPEAQPKKITVKAEA